VEGAARVEERLANAYATLQKADADMVKSQASWITTIANVRKMTVDTAKLLQEVRSMRLDNRVKACDTYYKKRERRQQYRSQHAEKRPDLETYVRVANATKPERLMKYQFDPDRGKIFWPALLEKPEFAPYREELDALFALGSAKSSGLKGELLHRVNTLSRQMEDELKSHVRELNQMEYIAAKNFIQGLAYEARFMPQLESVAAN
jgi:hypothetical protein